MNSERLEHLKKVKPYKELSETEGFKVLKEFLQSQINNLLQSALVGTENEHDSIVEARAYNKLLNYIHTQIQTANRISKELDE